MYKITVGGIKFFPACWRLLLVCSILSGCGGGGGSDGPSSATPVVTPTLSPEPTPTTTVTPIPTVTPTPQPAGPALHSLVNDPDARAAVRLLSQATFGATESSIREVMATSPEAWIDNQMALPMVTHLPLVDARIREVGLDPFDKSNDSEAYLKDLQRNDLWWDDAMHGNAQLRQRVAFALSQIFVISNISDTLFHDTRGMADYHDMLQRHAFGNYRELIERVTLHPMMGEYLSMVRNEKANAARNVRPDENYARELMQLFSIGLEVLNNDGSVVLSPETGEVIPTYTQDTVKAFARVFTGWMYGDAPRWFWFERRATSEVLPMRAFEAFHDTETKVLLNGEVLPAGQTAQEDLTAALDNIFAHPNVPPFISKQLIQRLVTSNPSLAYVERISQVFQNNGEGVRGDLGAVVRAILLDDEARQSPEERLALQNILRENDPQIQFNISGQLKEPLLKVASVWRAFNVAGVTTIDEFGNEGRAVIRYYDSNRELGQRPYGSPSVFNFFRPDFTQGGDIFEAGQLSPEFQILSENAITAVTNRLFLAAYFSDVQAPQLAENFNRLWGIGPVGLDFSVERTVAQNPEQLIARLNLLLFAGEMPESMESALVEHISLLPNEDIDGRNLRVSEAIFLMTSSPEFAVRR